MLKIFIRERRMERHITQNELAAKLVNAAGQKLTQSQISKYEKGKVAIPLGIILQIAEILKCKSEDLICNE